MFIVKSHQQHEELIMTGFNKNYVAPFKTEDEINRERAFMELLQDEDHLCDALVSIPEKIAMMISDTNNCYPREHGARLEDVISNAHTWQSLVDLIKDEMSDAIDEKVREDTEDVREYAENVVSFAETLEEEF